MDLRSLIDSVKQHDFENKEVQNKILEINNRYEELAADMNGERKLNVIKGSVVRLKKEIKEVSLNEGVVQNTLFSCTHMKAGKHHLYDEVVVGDGISP